MVARGRIVILCFHAVTRHCWSPIRRVNHLNSVTNGISGLHRRILNCNSCLRLEKSGFKPGIEEAGRPYLVYTQSGEDEFPRGSACHAAIVLLLIIPSCLSFLPPLSRIFFLFFFFEFGERDEETNRTIYVRCEQVTTLKKRNRNKRSTMKGTLKKYFLKFEL